MPTNEQNKTKKGKGFFGKMIERLDKKMKEKANKTSCCGSGTVKGKDSSCC